MENHLSLDIRRIRYKHQDVSLNFLVKIRANFYKKVRISPRLSILTLVKFKFIDIWIYEFYSIIKFVCNKCN